MTFDVTFLVGRTLLLRTGGKLFEDVRASLRVIARDRAAAYGVAHREFTAAGSDVVVVPHGPDGVPLGFTPAEREAVLALGVPFEGDRLPKSGVAGAQFERIEAPEPGQ